MLGEGFDELFVGHGGHHATSILRVRRRGTAGQGSTPRAGGGGRGGVGGSGGCRATGVCSGCVLLEEAAEVAGLEGVKPGRNHVDAAEARVHIRPAW